MSTPLSMKMDKERRAVPIDDATLWELCRDKNFRHQLAFVALGRGLAKQIRVMRRSRGWTQQELARRVGTSQPRIALLEVWCGNASLKTLQRIAAVFDVALIVRFVSWGDFFLSLGRAAVAPLSFDQEMELAQAVAASDPHVASTGKLTTRDSESSCSNPS